MSCLAWAARVTTKLAPLVLLASALVGGCQRAESSATGVKAEALAATSASAPLHANSVVVYYFHGNRRCRTCMAIQRAVQTTVSERFARETAAQTLVFREVNIDEPANAHFVTEFELSASSMVVVAKRGEKVVKWENCSEVWPLAHQSSKLEAYVEQQIRSYLELARKT